MTVSAVNVMTMNYGTSFGGNMGDYAVRAATAAQSQLKQALGLSDRAAWQGLGVTPMIGVNDVKGETFTLGGRGEGAEVRPGQGGGAGVHVGDVPRSEVCRRRQHRGGAGQLQRRGPGAGRLREGAVRKLTGPRRSPAPVQQPAADDGGDAGPGAPRRRGPSSSGTAKTANRAGPPTASGARKASAGAASANGSRAGRPRAAPTPGSTSSPARRTAVRTEGVVERAGHRHHAAREQLLGAAAGAVAPAGLARGEGGERGPGERFGCRARRPRRGRPGSRCARSRAAPCRLTRPGVSTRASGGRGRRGAPAATSSYRPIIAIRSPSTSTAPPGTGSRSPGSSRSAACSVNTSGTQPQLEARSFSSGWAVPPSIAVEEMCDWTRVVDRVVRRVVVHDEVLVGGGALGGHPVRPCGSCRSSRMRLERCLAPAEETTFSSSMIEPRSSAP